MAAGSPSRTPPDAADAPPQPAEDPLHALRPFKPPSASEPREDGAPGSDAVPRSPRWTAARVGYLALLAVCFALGWAALFVQVATTTVAARQWGGTAFSTVPYGASPPLSACGIEHSRSARVALDLAALPFTRSLTAFRPSRIPLPSLFPPLPGVLAAAHALWALPAQLIIRASRSARPSFIAGGALGVLGNALFAVAAALAHDSPSASSSSPAPPTQPAPMALLCAGALFAGLANAYINFLRFEAARFAPSAAHLPTAISAVVAGGVVGGGMGPIISRVTRGVIPGHEFLATYLVSCGLFLAEMLLVALIPLHGGNAHARHQQDAGGDSCGSGGGGAGSTSGDKEEIVLGEGPGGAGDRGCQEGGRGKGESEAIMGDGDGQEGAKDEEKGEGIGEPKSSSGCDTGHGSLGASRVGGWCCAGAVGGGKVGDGHACSGGVDGRGGEVHDSTQGERDNARRTDMTIGCYGDGNGDGKEMVGREVKAGPGREEGEAVVVLVGAGRGGEGSGNTAAGGEEQGRRRWYEVMRQPGVVVAVAAATVAYAGMATIMLTAVIAMLAVQPGTGDVELQGQLGAVITFADTSNVILVHVEAMFVPSFFTPAIIAALGSDGAMLLGFVLLLASQLALLAGTTLPLFFLCLALLGLGWNLAFVGATALLATTYRPHEKDMVQGINDGIVFGVNTIVASTASVVLQTINSWPTFLLIYSLASSPALFITLAFWLARRHLLPFHWPGVAPPAPPLLPAPSCLPLEAPPPRHARGAWGGKGKQLVRSLSKRLGVSGRVAGMKWG
ncbi:unnamed protein product [Closterium sp. NIES-64]|nr:unnamed protein product [Closterium sp. NIES-64]